MSLQRDFNSIWRVELSKPGVEKSFWEQVCFEIAGCWSWNGKFNKNGVAIFSISEYGKKIQERRVRSIPAHRACYLLTRGLLPAGSKFHIRRSCRNKICVKPSHLSFRIAKKKIDD